MSYPDVHLVTQIADERIVITGGAGFIGSTLAGVLLDRNDVVIYDDFTRDALSTSGFADHPNLTTIKGDVLDVAGVEKALHGATYIVHCAGIAGIDTVIRDPVRTLQVNMIGSANVLEAARGATGLKRLTCFSTSEVFGSLAYMPEESSPTTFGAVGEARWVYAVSKLAEEHLAHAYFSQHGLPTVTVRPFNVYGPGQVGEGAIRTFILRALAGEDLLIHGDGGQIRAWCYVDDMIDGILRTMTLDAAVGESFNIGNQRAVTTIHGLASTVVRVLGSSSSIRFVPRPSADIELRVPHSEKARTVLGFDAKVDLEEGIEQTAECYAAAGISA